LVLNNRGAIPKKVPPVFSRENVRADGLVGGSQDAKILPNRIIIPDLSIDLPVQKARIVAGYWEVFDSTAGWGEGSGLPGQPGNQIIFAHAREGLFLPLRQIKTGAKVYVFTQDKWYSYEVKDTKEVYPNQLEVIAPTQDETLTLYTCSGYADTKRMIVIAKRV